MSQKTAKNTRAQIQTKSDPTVYLVTAAFVVMLVSVWALRKLGRLYVLNGTFLQIYAATVYAAWIFGVIAAAALALWIVLRKNRVARTVCPYVAAISALWFVTALILRNNWANEMKAIYLMHASFYCLYIVYLLYRAEFFFVSLATVTAGITFYLYHFGFGPNARSVTIGVVLALSLLVCVLTALLAAKNKGMIVVKGHALRVFPPSYSPVLMCITCLIWAVLYLLTLLIGSAFAYYCIFVAVAYELIAAVYYTFQLK